MTNSSTARPRVWLRLLRAGVAALTEILSIEPCRACGRNWCAPTGREHTAQAVCVECWKRIAVAKPSVRRCHFEDGLSMLIASGARYDGVLKRLIYKLKYDHDLLLAADLSRLLIGAAVLLPACARRQDTLLVPVPLHSERLRQRGFNQAELLAAYVAKALGVTMETEALKRIRQTAPQHDLGRTERALNLSGAFGGDEKRLAGATVILVDDIYTSGATLAEAAREVLRLGASSVFALTVARAILRRENTC